MPPESQLQYEGKFSEGNHWEGLNALENIQAQHLECYVAVLHEVDFV